MSDVQPQIGDMVPTVKYDSVNRTDFVKYAGASGDFARIHFDDEFVCEKGFQSVFGQGMFTAGLVSNAITDWLSLRRVLLFRVQFVDQLWPGESVIVTGKVTDVISHRGQKCAEIELDAYTAEDRKLVKGKCVVTVQPV